MSAAPSSAMRSPSATAASRDSKRPPSEKESGVTLSTPITRGWVRSSVLSAQRRRTGGDGMQVRPLMRPPEAPGVNTRFPDSSVNTELSLEGPLDADLLPPVRGVPVCLVLPCRNDRSPGRRWRCGRPVRERIVPAGGWFRCLAGHDVPQLLLVDGLVLHERFGHQMQLVERGGEDLPGTLVV